MKRRKTGKPKDLMWAWNCEILTFENFKIKAKHEDPFTTRCINFHCLKEGSRSVS